MMQASLSAESIAIRRAAPQPMPLQASFQAPCRFEVTLDEALERLEAAMPQPSTEDKTLPDALGRILAAPFDAPTPFPPFSRALMDGYAARHADLMAGGRLTLRPPSPSAPIGTGECCRIATGAAIPPGADVVLRQENVTVIGGQLVLPTDLPAPGRDCEAVGHVCARHTTLIQAGTRLNPSHLALAARHGCNRLTVHAPLRVGLIVTGNELCAPGTLCGPGQVFDSNRILIESFLRQQPARIGWATPRIYPDQPDLIAAALDSALQSTDLVFIVGGSSVGDHDHSRALLSRFGSMLFTGIAIRPGRPVSAARAFDGKVIVALPGSPNAVTTLLHVLIEPLLQGRKNPEFAALGTPTHGSAESTVFLPGRWQSEENGGEFAVRRVIPLAKAAFDQAECLLELPPRAEVFTPHEILRIRPLFTG